MKAWIKKYWKHIAAGLVVIGAALAYGFRAVLGGKDSGLQELEDAINANAKKDRERVLGSDADYKAEMVLERTARAELEADRVKANAENKGKHEAIDAAGSHGDVDGEIR